MHRSKLALLAAVISLSISASEETRATEPTGSMATVRSHHAAVTLPDGRVLIAGGHTISGSITSMTAAAEIYDPATGLFAPTGSLTVGRGELAAARLADGRVLALGGLGLVNGSPANLASAEIYDPAAGTWTATGSMSTPRRNAIALALPDGRALVIGGDQDTAACEIFDPVTGTFSPTGSLLTSRGYMAAAVLQDGRVLVVGGYSASFVDQSSAEIWDPASGNWSPTGAMSAARAGLSATTLEDGRVLVAGGNSSNVFPPAPELYDPATGTFSPAGSLNAPRTRHAATRLADGSVLLLGGSAATFLPERRIERYDVASSTWQIVDSLLTARSTLTASPLGNEVLIAGGTPGPLASAEIFNAACAPFHPSISPGSQSFPASGGSGSVSVTHAAGCGWAVSNALSWVTITSPSQGSGNGIVTYTVAPNTGTGRGGILSIANNSFSVNQATGVPPCNGSFVPTISPTSQSFPASGGTGSISVTHDAGCQWVVSNVPAWMSIVSGSSGYGSGTVTYSVAANTGGTRSASLSVATKTFAVSQAAPAAANCNFVNTLFPGTSYSGTLSATDCTQGARGASYYTDRYSFNGTAGQQVAFQLSSTAFDTYLYLRTPTGSVWLSNDDGGGGTNSRIPASSGGYTLPAGMSGTWVIEVTSFSAGRTGAYTLLRVQ